MSLLQPVAHQVKSELTSVEKYILKALGEKQTKELRPYVTHLASFKGKRLRPALMILTAKLCGVRTAPHDLIAAAAALELLHRASLIHDDIIDCSPTRHHRKTTYARYGQEQAIVLGDWLIAGALELLSQCSHKAVRMTISHAMTEVSQGQLLQLKLRGRVFSEQRYSEIVTQKTASLFIAAMKSGVAFSTGVKPSMLRAAETFGRQFGRAFQIIDDLEDLVGTTTQTGKKALGQDIQEGEMTLPLLYLFDMATPQEKKRFRQVFAAPSKKGITDIITLFKQSPALQKTKHEACNSLSGAAATLSYFPNNTYRKTLHTMLAGLSERVDGL